MSYLRINVIDQTQTISGEVHGSEGDALVAALAAEPETIDELAIAFARFTQSSNLQHQPHTSLGNQEQSLPIEDGEVSSTHYHESPFRRFARYENLEPYDAGILVIDLAARVVAIDSTYSMPSVQGEIRLLINETTSLASPEHHKLPDTDREQINNEWLTGADIEQVHDDLLFMNESAANFYADDSPDEIPIFYHLSDDWLFVYSIPEYEGVCQKRREARLATQPIDARAVLYGKPMLEFIACECLVALERFTKSANPIQRNAIPVQTDEIEDKGTPTATFDDYEQLSEAQQEIISKLHVKWWMTGREDLQSKTPRHILLVKQDSIDRDLQSRELQWSFTGKCPPSLPTTSKAYLYAGFGTHEIVIYYDLIRYLLKECFQYLQTATDISSNAITEFLEKLKNFWLEMPNSDYMGKLPSRYMKLERQRIPFVMSVQNAIIDHDCPLCTMSEIFNTPGFWHLDGAHMDDCFEFSFHQTREEWQAEQHRREEFNREFNRKWQEKEQASFNEDSPLSSDDDSLIH
jgi:hypothetical protein